MAMSEKSRSTLYQGFVGLIPDEQAVEEMLSYFPARDVEEPVTKDHLRAEIALVRTELHAEMALLRVEMSELRTGLKGEMSELRTELKVDLERMVRTMQAWMIGTAVSIGGIVVAASAVLH